ncbi:MotA/TolQ/ExbB proton channel [Desulfurobacterium thermolithotrophum DSM 11699]|uniref:MotA/TolQ/ExbB proton channel n=1 Tax=Desulfurobacterium thermolithotrophum (strain DSM 11699 / BSA) TaxID=868864 RepID=F0S2X7_DESTD|nr:MotA/TolQ/ExbB proton channel family protein [Desulfurobacterium thermolithotrophum]ADY73199.1 MotA/TolQ/ExbB proton channel [Desulfurobacterium thermolithotrophum DSM 11699]
MDIATLIGIAGAFLLIIISIVIGGSPGAFINVPSLLITVGGGIAAGMAGFPLGEFINGFKAILKAINPGMPNPIETIDFLTDVAKKARKEGILALESDIDAFYGRDSFFGDVMRMLIDGLEIEEIKSTAESSMAQIEQKLSTEVAVWETLGDLFPAFGMIGTLIGLIQMLQNLSDPSALGPGMAVAMITTLYGAILANVLCIPVAKKLKYYKDLRLLYLEAYLLTAEAIEKGLNPNLLKQKLAGLLGVEIKEG